MRSLVITLFMVFGLYCLFTSQNVKINDNDGRIIRHLKTCEFCSEDENNPSMCYSMQKIMLIIQHQRGY